MHYVALAMVGASPISLYAVGYMARIVSCVFLVCLSMGLCLKGQSASAIAAEVYIWGDEELAVFMAGLPGEGTAEDPYVISALVLDVRRADYGIWIENTRAFLVIEDCRISHVWSPTSVGAIVLRNCRNVTIRGCILQHNRVGIHLSRCEGLVVVQNELLENECGVVLDRFSVGNTLAGNRFDCKQNALAVQPNVWTGADGGNCWSDLAEGESTYVVSAGNVDSAPSSIHLCPSPADTAPPVISSSDLLPVDVEAGATLLDFLPKIYAIDRRDGAIECISRTDSIDMCTPGQYEVVYEACDTSQNCVSGVLIVRVVDTSPPVIEFLGPSVLALEAGADCALNDPGAIATDLCTQSVQVVASYEDVQNCVPGDYRATYTACDASGNCSRATRPVRVVDTTPPELHLIGPNPLVVDLGADPSRVDPGVEVLDECSSEGESAIRADWSGVMPDTPGAYVVRYQACDVAGNCSGDLLRNVIVGLGPPPEVCPARNGYTCSITEWRIEDDAIICSFEAITTLGEPNLVRQLQAGGILADIITIMPSMPGLRLCYEISMEAGPLIQGQILADDLAALREMPRISSLDALLSATPLLGSASQPSGFAGEAPSIEAARERAVAIVKYLVDGSQGIIIKAYIDSLAGNRVYFLDILYQRPPGEVPPTIEAIQSEAKGIAVATARALQGDARVAVSTLIEGHGLVYRGELDTNDGLDWTERFAHPVLGP